MKTFQELRNWVLEQRSRGVAWATLDDSKMEIYGTKNSTGTVQFTLWFNFCPEGENLNFVEQSGRLFWVYANFMEENELKREKYGVFKFDESISELKASSCIDEAKAPLAKRHIARIADCLINFPKK